MERNILTHELEEVDFNSIVEKTRKRIKELGNKDDVTVQERLDLLKQLTEFEFGRYMLVHRGLNGYWTRYINLYPKRKHEYNLTHSLEKFFLEKACGALSSQQRFDINQGLLQKYIKNGMTLCSLPCGFMDDLLTLDLSKTPNVRFVGIDIDEESINGAKKNAKDLNLESICTFHVMDAWKIEFKNEFDILTSNMLVQYSTDEKAIIKFYRIVYDSLKENGILTISCLLPPPADSGQEKYETKVEKIVIQDIIQPKWTNFQPIEKMIQQLKDAGFKTIDTYYDQNKRFPTLLARK